MSYRVKSVMDSGGEGSIIDVECTASNGLPTILIVGYASKAVDEAKERVKSAFSSEHLELARKRLTINLAPADIPKDGTAFDLAIAAVILAVTKQLTTPEDAVFIGELGLDGSVRPVRGIIGQLLQARNTGLTTCFIPIGNLEQATLVPGLQLYPVNSLKQLYLHLTNTQLIPVVMSGTQTPGVHAPPPTSTIDFSEVIGQRRAKRALEIAAAGMHNVMLNGPPGTGKSMLAKALPSIIPPMRQEEVLEVTHLHSLVARQYDKIINTRPFRAPHHTSSDISIIGGGQYPRPGEISLSHHGVLLFDEFPEFSRRTIEALRQPLEDRYITIARSKGNITFPADFILLATSNPCPCGYFGTHKACVCLPQQVQKYQKKISGPVIDRIDLYVDVEEIRHARLLSDNQEETSADIRKRITGARTRQAARYEDSQTTNGRLSNKQIKSLLTLTPDARNLLDKAAEQLSISARSYMRVIKVSQTIADLDNSEHIDTTHISEALQYRRPTPT